MKGIQYRHISFTDVKERARQDRRNIMRMISGVLDEGIFLHGAQNSRLEEKLCSFLGGGYIKTVASGHDTLLLALQSLHLSPRDEVIFPVNSYPTAFPVALSGARPVPVDVDENGQINPKEVEKKITNRTKAIIAVHLYGLVGDIEKIRALTRKNKLVLIEDCAQSLGACFKGRTVGTWGDISCFSFYPTKNAGTIGDGGAIWTRNTKYHQFFTQARSYGEKIRYKSLFISGHSRLPEAQAGVISLYLARFGRELEKKKKIALMYYQAFRRKKLLSYMTFLSTSTQSTPSYHLMVVRAQKRDKLQAFLKKYHIESLIHYPYPVHLVPAFSHLGFKKGDFPCAEGLAKEIISLPFHAFLRRHDIEYIADIIRVFYEKT